MIRNATLLLALLLALQATSAFAQDKPFVPFPPILPFPDFQGTADEQRACRPDVVRLCPDEAGRPNPDSQRILACLQANRGRLKPACRDVLASHGV